VSALVYLVLACGLPRLAAAQPALDVDEHAPFTAAQLDAALRVRVRDVAFEVRVVAIYLGVEITVRGRTRDVALGTRTGDDAARLVALAAADLVLPDMALPPPIERVHDEPPARSEPVPARGWAIGLMGTSAVWDGVVAGGSADLVGPVRGALVAVEFGGGALVGGDLHATTAIVRAGLATRISVLELRAGLTLVPLQVTDGTTDTTVLVGGGASARLRLPIATGVRVVLAAGADAYATRTEYFRAGMAPASTPMVAPFFGAGIELTP
jgi:hypothetical protein